MRVRFNGPKEDGDDVDGAVGGGASRSAAPPSFGCAFLIGDHTLPLPPKAGDGKVSGQGARHVPSLPERERIPAARLGTVCQDPTTADGVTRGPSVASAAQVDPMCLEASVAFPQAHAKATGPDKPRWQALEDSWDPVVESMDIGVRLHGLRASCLKLIGGERSLAGQ
jgi:hypothetical protein